LLNGTPKGVRIVVFFEYPISNKEFPMIKGGSRCAPLFYYSSLDRIFVFFFRL
jgi:hypothetical protein